MFRHVRLQKPLQAVRLKEPFQNTCWHAIHFNPFIARLLKHPDAPVLILRPIQDRPGWNGGHGGHVGPHVGPHFVPLVAAPPMPKLVHPSMFVAAGSLNFCTCQLELPDTKDTLVVKGHVAQDAVPLAKPFQTRIGVRRSCKHGPNIMFEIVSK